MSTNYAAAYNAHRADLRAAINYSDPDAFQSEVAAKRVRLIAAARDRLVAATPEAPTAAGPSMAEVFAARRPQNADQVALQAREREIASSLAKAGRTSAQILAEASELRVAALLDDVETLRAMDPVAANDFEVQAFQRLVALGAADAVAASTAEADVAVQAAWAAALKEAQTGDVSVAARMLVLDADPEGYAASLGSDPSIDWRTVEQVEAGARA